MTSKCSSPRLLCRDLNWTVAGTRCSAYIITWPRVCVPVHTCVCMCACLRARLWVWCVRGLARRPVVLLSAAGGAYWPLVIYPCPSLEPFPSVGGGAHRPLGPQCPASPCLACPYLHTLPFPREVVPTESPDCPCFTAPCRVHMEEGNCPLCWPGASK